MVPGWSPDGTIQRAIQSCSGSSILASLCGSAAETYPTVLFFRADFVFWHIFDFLDFKRCFIWKNCNKIILLTFLGPAATYRTGFLFVRIFFWHIFDFLDFRHCFIWKNCNKLTLLTFLGPAATYRTGLFSCVFFVWHIFDFLDFKTVLYGTSTQNSLFGDVFQDFQRILPAVPRGAPWRSRWSRHTPYPPPRGDRGQGPGNKNSPQPPSPHASIAPTEVP